MDAEFLEPSVVGSGEGNYGFFTVYGPGSRLDMAILPVYKGGYGRHPDQTL